MHQLNDALTDQQRQIDQLHTRLDRLRQQLEAVSVALPAQSVGDEVPPHY